MFSTPWVLLLSLVRSDNLLKEVDDVGRNADGENSSRQNRSAHQKNGDDFVGNTDERICFHT